MRNGFLAVVLLAALAPGHVRAAPLTANEATFLDWLVTAAAVLEQRCAGYEADGAGGVQLGARLLGSPDAAMAIIDAFNTAIKAYDGETYDPSKFRPEVLEVASRTAKRVKAELVRNPKVACAGYGDAGADSGLLRRY